MDHFFDLEGPQIVFTNPLMLTIWFSENIRGPIIPNTETLYRWQNGLWVMDGITLTGRWSNGFSTQIEHLSLFGVLGETYKVYLPIILK